MKTIMPVLALSFLASALAARPVAAATASASFSVSATVQASCLATVTATAIKTYPAAADAAAAVLVACSNSAPYSVSLDSGVVHNATVAILPMTGSRFALLGDALSSIPRGIANRGQAARTIRLAGIGGGSNSLPTIHDLIPAAHCAQLGPFADTMFVVVTY